MIFTNYFAFRFPLSGHQCFIDLNELKPALSKLDPATVYADLGEDAVLLCWEENSGAFCHRRRVAEWLGETLGVLVPGVAAGSADDRGHTRLSSFIPQPPKEVK